MKDDVEVVRRFIRGLAKLDLPEAAILQVLAMGDSEPDRTDVAPVVPITPGVEERPKIRAPIERPKEELLEFISGYFDVYTTLKLDTPIRAGLAQDTMALMDFILALEERFDVSLTDAEITAMRTVGDLLAYLQTEATKRTR